MTLIDTGLKIKVGRSLSHSFYVQQGLRQGDPLSIVLFNLILHHVIKKSYIQIKLYFQKVTSVLHLQMIS